MEKLYWYFSAGKQPQKILNELLIIPLASKFLKHQKYNICECFINIDETAEETLA